MKTLDNKRKVILLYNFDACGWGEFEGVNVKLSLLRCEQVGCIIKSLILPVVQRREVAEY